MAFKKALTCTLAMQSAVMEFILVPDTPGGFSPNIARRLSSSSATADMTRVLDAKRVGGRNGDEVEVRPLEIGKVGTRGRKGGWESAVASIRKICRIRARLWVR